ncbi:GNAT family N-acetyltransferase [bacterium]|nr:GNAT family N-acetyltransferase [bacterium]
MNKPREIKVMDAPDIEGLSFRHFAGESDYPKMIAIIEKVAEADEDEHVSTLEDLRHNYEYLTHSDPANDMIFAEINGEVVAYSRVAWHQEQDPNHRIYMHFINIMPEWRNNGIELSVLKWCEDRLLAIASDHPKDSQRFFQTYAEEKKQDFNEMLKSQGYFPARYDYSMSRPLDEIPEAVLPEGIEVRPASEENVRKIWEASVEAFGDHWGFSEPDEREYENYAGSKYFQPDLWQVAWDGDEVVSSVMNYIDHDYNQKFKKSIGWTENISTRREWRRRGIARALIVRSMHMHKELGMTEVGLGVDTENPNGALQLYESLGYQQKKTNIAFRKEMK